MKGSVRTIALENTEAAQAERPEQLLYFPTASRNPV
jgi:hypothetical protein